MMRTIKRMALPVIAGIFLFSANGCGKSEDKSATTADKVQNAVENAGKELGQAMEKAGQELKETGEKITRGAEESAKKEEKR